MMLKHCSKCEHFSYPGMVAKAQLAALDNRDLKQTLEAARWMSTGSKISRSRANYHNHVEFCPRPPTVAAVRKVGFTASRDGHFIFRFVARKIHGNSSI